MLMGCTLTTRRCGLHHYGLPGLGLPGSAHRGAVTGRVLAGHVSHAIGSAGYIRVLGPEEAFAPACSRGRLAEASGFAM